MRIVVLTSCTNRKKVAPVQGLSAHDLPVAPPAVVAATWVQRLSAAVGRVRVSDLYSGRAFSEARAAAAESKAALYVLSAGLGIVAADAQAPGYALTIVRSAPDCVLRRVAECGDAAQWWMHLAAAQGVAMPVANLVRQYPSQRIVIACSSAYVQMIQADLQSLPDDELLRVRLIGPQMSATLPERLASLVMPYDGRFDGPRSPNPGTRSDFPQRAARHFLSLPLEASPRAPAADAGVVRAVLGSWPWPTTIRRKTQSDEEIRTLIEAHWHRAGGNSARMLRILRDELQVACEQKRFAGLFRGIKQGAGRDG